MLFHRQKKVSEGQELENGTPGMCRTRGHSSGGVERALNRVKVETSESVVEATELQK